MDVWATLFGTTEFPKDGSCEVESPTAKMNQRGVARLSLAVARLQLRGADSLREVSIGPSIRLETTSIRTSSWQHVVNLMGGLILIATLVLLCAVELLNLF